MTDDIAVIILAAGASTRLGQPKQLLPFGSTTLLRHAAQTAISAECGPVHAVLGDDADRMRVELGGLPTTVIDNRDWAEGISSSIRAGIGAIKSESQIAAALLMLCDQPRVTTDILRQLVAAYRAGSPIAACTYAKAIGVPALFDRSLFGQLLLLRGERGAKSIIEQHRSQVAIFPFPDGAIDIDTPADAKGL